MAGRRRQGFTLLELVITLFVVSLIAGAIYSNMRTAFRARNAIENAVEPLHRVGVTMDFLKRDLECVPPPTGVLAGAFTAINGTTDRGQEGDDLVFYAPVDAPATVDFPTDIRKVEYAVVTLDGEQVLMRYVTSNLLSPMDIDPDEEVLCRGVRSFNLRYYDGTDWWDDWDSTQQNNALPLAVEATLELEPVDTGADPITVSRMIMLPCWTEVDSTSTDSTGTSGTSGTTGGS